MVFISSISQLLGEVVRKFQVVGKFVAEFLSFASFSEFSGYPAQGYVDDLDSLAYTTANENR